MNKRKLEFSSHSGNLALVRKYVREFLGAHSFTEKERLLIVLGIDEACTNIIRYAYELRDNEMICLTLESMSSRIRVRLRDYGKQAAKEAMKNRVPDLVRPGGLGLHLIRNAFDRVEYILRKRGTELVLTKHLK